ncbi:MAG: DNA polymerase IV [Candidatus Omnitrophota bacterium]
MHVDMDAFFASVEQRDHPELLGKPVVVGGSPADRGVVAAASYEARQFGIRSAMPMAKALRLCPQAVRRPCNFAAYKDASRRIHQMFREITPLVEPVSLDEAYLDLSEQAVDLNHAEAIGRRLKIQIKEETRLNASVGIGSNKFLAKIASDYDKPDGFYVVRPDDALSFLSPLPVRAIPGVGQKTEQRLTMMGLRTIEELRALSLEELVKAFGEKHGARLYQLARGVDSAPVVVERERKSLSQERTFSQDLSSVEGMKYFIEELSHQVADRLDKVALEGRTVGIKVRFHDFRLLTRAMTLDHPTRDPGVIAEAAINLLERVELSNRRVRLLGVRITGFDDIPDDKKISESDNLQMTFWDVFDI